jgi:hypothetical protein
MTKDLIQEKLSRALETLAKDDKSLLDSNVNERSMTHQLAVYLTDEFSDYDVDCEYNRMFNEGVLERKTAIRIEKMEKVSIGDIDAKTAYPDIIVHRREDDKHNLLIIEAKKSGAINSEDYRKLNGFMEKKSDHGLGYEFSAFVIFDTETPDKSIAKVKQRGERW